MQPHGNIFWHFQVRPKSWKSYIVLQLLYFWSDWDISFIIWRKDQIKTSIIIIYGIQASKLLFFLKSTVIWCNTMNYYAKKWLMQNGARFFKHEICSSEFFKTIFKLLFLEVKTWSYLCKKKVTMQLHYYYILVFFFWSVYL